MKKKALALFLATAMTLSLAACGSSTGSTTASAEPEASESDEGAAGGTEIEVTQSGGSDEESATFDRKTKVTATVISLDTNDPYNISGAIVRDFLIYEPLFAFNSDNTGLEGVIAKEWTMDGTGVDVTIYDYVYDSEGNHITAEDVAFSYNAFVEAGVNTGSKYIASAEATGEYDVHIEYTEDVYPLLIASSVRVPIVSEAAYSAPDADFVAHPIGTGHYVCTAFSAGQSGVYEKRDDHWQTDESLVNYAYKANVDVVELDVINETAQIQTGLETGNLQIGQITATISAAFESNPDIAVTVLNGQYNHMLALNCYQGVLSESKELREAILYCINSEELAIACTGGTGSKPYSIVNGENIHGYQKAWEDEDYYDYDLEKARELVKEAGYDPDDTGITLKWLGSNKEDVILCSQAIQAYLSQIGIGLEINNLDNTTYMAQRNAYDESAWDLAFTDGVPKGDFVQGINVSVNNTQYALGNMYGVNDDTLQELLLTARYDETDENVDALHQYIKEGAGLYGMYVDYNFWGHHKDLQIVTGNDGEISAGASILGADYDVFVD